MSPSHPLPATVIAAVREIVAAHQSDPTLSVLRTCHLVQVALAEALTDVENWEADVGPYYEQLVLRTGLERLAEACDDYRGLGFRTAREVARQARRLLREVEADDDATIEAGVVEELEDSLEAIRAVPAATIAEQA